MAIMNDDVKAAVALVKAIDKAETEAQILNAFGKAQEAVKQVYLRKITSINKN